MPPSQADIDEEQRHFANVITAFQSYASYSLAANNRRRKDLYTLPKSHADLLATLGYKQKLDEVDAAVLENAKFLSEIVENPEIFGHAVEEGEAGEVAEQHQAEGGHSHSGTSSRAIVRSNGRQKPYKPSDFDMDKIRSTLKQFVREWSEEGRDERERCYKPMKGALVNHFSDIPLEERRNFRVLVPGAGLARLAHDVANLGFSCQANEFSHYMLLASYFILNRTDAIDQHTIYPYVHSFSNSRSRTSMLRAIHIPDVLPTALPEGSDFSLVAGDFEEIYGSEAIEAGEPQAGQWDAILTCFFIDTAKDIVNYLRIIHRILTPGGIWINLGPLLWHFENNTTNDASVELDLEELKMLMDAVGFDVSNERTIDTSYTHDSQSMLGYTYHAEFWTATKRI
ncbi:N2227-domain-containing protein [Mycena floridula]|nr:N2227-domain-containing protein [Mycena floridula]